MQGCHYIFASCNAINEITFPKIISNYREFRGELNKNKNKRKMKEFGKLKNLLVFLTQNSKIFMKRRLYKTKSE